MKNFFNKSQMAFLLTTSCIGLFLGLSTAYASVIDAPHNETNNIQCGDCHTYSLWWTHSPAASSPIYSQIADDVCNKCHGNGQYAPNKLAHSATTMAEMHKTTAGDWQTKCIDCHDPHLQGQLDWLATNPSLATDLYIATGKRGSGAMTYDSQTNTTSFDYIDADAKSSWLNPTLWAVKSDSTRGLILVVEDTNGSSTFEINAAIETLPISQGTPSGAGTIEVQGEIPATFVSGTTFSLIYGQLLRQKIITPNGSEMPVKFFDAGILYSSGLTGGPADPVGTPPEGICQVCHYYTRYYNYDGLRPDPNDIDFPDGARTTAVVHNTSSACNECHDVLKGFKPINADHTFISSATTTCENCHLASQDFVVDVHAGNCEFCHTNAPILKGTVTTGTSGKWPSTPHDPGTCYDCHDSDGPAPYDIMADFTNHPNAFDSDGNPSNGFDGHNGQLSVTPTCTDNCHFHSGKELVTEIHTGGPVPSNPCMKCHELTEVTPPTYTGTQLTAKGTYSGSGKLIGSATAGQGDCANCHSAIATNWKNHPGQASHAGQVDDTGTNLCSRCHTYNPANPELIIDSIHASNCGNCHDGSNQGALISLTKTNGPGDCINCHGSEFYLHDYTQFKTFNHESYGLVTPEPAGSAVECMLCHNEGASNPGGANMINDIHFPIIIYPEVLDPNFNVCAYCHDAQGYLIGSAAGHGFANMNGSPNTCSTCHPDHLTDHPQHTTLGMNGTLTDTATCVTCHSGEKTEVIHNNKCLLCHEALFRSQIASLRTGLPDPATYGDADDHLECIECHTALDNSFFSADSRIAGDKLGHSKDTDHLGKVEGLPGCSSCHDGAPLYDVHYGSGLCVGCHTQDGVLKGSAAGLGTGKPAVGTENDCTTCHGTFDLHSSLPIDLSHTLEVTLTPSCAITGCHTEPDLVLGIHDLNGCATCHSSSGDLNAPAVPFGGDCQTCHTTYFDGHQHGINEHFVSVGTDTSVTLLAGDQPCYICHHDLTWGGIRTLHDINSNGGCATCHDSARVTDIGAGFTSVPDVILVGDVNTPIYCLDCHSDATTYSHYCGNGIINDVGEVCDDGVLNSDTTPDACRTNCSLPTCGDGVIDSGETCDDGNTIPGDGCDDLCQDTEAPLITLLGATNDNAECAVTYSDPGSTVTDNVSTGLSAIVTGSVDVGTVGAYSLYYNATDNAGNAAIEEIRTVSVADTTSPIITLTGSNPVDLFVGEVYTEDGATATDSCAIIDAVTIAGTVDTNTPGIYSITYDVQDSQGNPAVQVTRTVNVTAPICGNSVIEPGETCDDGNTTPGDGCDEFCQDTEAPVIILLGATNDTAECAVPYIDPGSTVTDNASIGLSAIVTGSVDVGTVSANSLYYNATDDAGNAAIEKIRTVSVDDTTPPIITLTGSDPVNLLVNEVYTEEGATATDSCAIIDTVTIAGTVDTNTPGIYTITYDVQDSQGNPAVQVTRTVNVTTP